MVGVARQIPVKEAVLDLSMVGTGYTYLQDYLPNMVQVVVGKEWIDAVGLGQMVLSYPELPADTLGGSINGAQANFKHVQRPHLAGGLFLAVFR